MRTSTLAVCGSLPAGWSSDVTYTTCRLGVHAVQGNPSLSPPPSPLPLLTPRPCTLSPHPHLWVPALGNVKSNHGFIITTRSPLWAFILLLYPLPPTPLPTPPPSS